ncbi:hypothetical protein K8R20_02165 [bacterium]|nr:hypothetical protein [bacterium]
MDPILELEKPTITNYLEERLFEAFQTSVELGSPLTEEDSRMICMPVNERRFSELLLDFPQLIVFPQPVIESMVQIPDFYIFNVKNGFSIGKFVEITLFPREKISNNGKGSKGIKRKHRQIEAFRSSGLPFVFLYRENQERMREALCSELF